MMKLQKIAKCKNTFILKAMRDRAISTKFLTPRVSLLSSKPKFQKKNCLAINGGHFERTGFKWFKKRLTIFLIKSAFSLE